MIEVLRRIKELIDKENVLNVDISSLEEIEKILTESLDKKVITDADGLDKYQKVFDINFLVHLNTIFSDNHFLEDYKKISNDVISNFLTHIKELKHDVLLKDMGRGILSHFDDDFSLKEVLSNEELDELLTSLSSFVKDPKEMLIAIKGLLEENARLYSKENESVMDVKTVRRLTDRSTKAIIDGEVDKKRRRVIAEKNQEKDSTEKKDVPLEEKKEESKLDKSIRLFNHFASSLGITYSEDKDLYKKYLARKSLSEKYDFDSRLDIYFIDKETFNVQAVIQDALNLINVYEKDKSNTDVQNLICSISDVIFSPKYLKRLYEASQNIFLNMYPSDVIDCYSKYSAFKDGEEFFKVEVQDILKNNGIFSENFIPEFLEHIKELNDIKFASNSIPSLDELLTYDKESFEVYLSYFDDCISKFNRYASKYMDLLHDKIASDSLNPSSLISAEKTYHELYDSEEKIGDGPDNLIYMKIVPVLHGEKDFIDLNGLSYSIKNSVLDAFILDDNDKNKIVFCDIMGDNVPSVISKIRDYTKNGSGDKLADIAEKFEFLRNGKNCKKEDPLTVTINNKKYDVWACRCSSNSGGQMRLYYVPFGDYAYVIDLDEKKRTAISKGSKKSISKRVNGMTLNEQDFEEMFERTKSALKDEVKSFTDSDKDFCQ